MSSQDVIKKDKNRAKNKVIISALFAIIVLFILIRVVALNATSEGGVTVVQPELDSVNLNVNKSKISQYTTEREQEEAKKYDYSSNGPDPANYNFKEMIGGATQSKTVVSQQQPVTEQKVVQKNENQYGRYSSLNNNNSQEELDSKQIEKLKKAKQKEVEYVEPVKEEVVESQSSKNPFGTFSYSKSKQTNTSGKTKDAYKCFLHSDQKIVNGGGAIFRAGEDIYLSDRVIRKNSILYGSANYQGQRVQIKINRVKSPEGEYAVNLTVYDNDFVKGIFFKNAYDEVAEKTTDDVASDGTNNTKLNLGNGIVGSATKVMIHAGKNVGDAIKKERALKLSEGYIIYIKDNTNDNQ